MVSRLNTKDKIVFAFGIVITVIAVLVYFDGYATGLNQYTVGAQLSNSYRFWALIAIFYVFIIGYALWRVLNKKAKE
jgi:type VI protein secretion system component VasK